MSCHDNHDSPQHDAPFVVLLSSAGNPDFDQDPRMALSPRILLPIWSIKDASRACREYISRCGLGAGNWTGGEVRDRAGRLVARVSFNGRIWTEDGDEWEE